MISFFFMTEVANHVSVIQHNTQQSWRVWPSGTAACSESLIEHSIICNRSSPGANCQVLVWYDFFSDTSWEEAGPDADREKNHKLQLQFLYYKKKVSGYSGMQQIITVLASKIFGMISLAPLPK
jgi:hypothetical protein